MAQGDMRVYDPDQYSASLAGIPFKGWADGEWIRVEPESDAFEDVVGTDGEVTRSKSNDRRATITVKLMQSSPVNLVLSGLYNTDINTPGGVGVGPFMLRDKQGTTVVLAEKAWIAREPNVVLDRTATEREWKIRCASLISVHGGN